ncbi:MAG: hypothetical protein AABM29_10330 [Actinomycetota bacterium]
MESAAAVEADLDFYGLCVRVGGEWADAVEELRLDFAWFARKPDGGAAEVEVVLERRPPEFDGFGDAPAAFVTPRNVVYQQDGRTIVDYFGRAVSVLDRTGERLVVQGEDKHLVHEAAYHFILSRVGQHLEAQGLTRLHALGLAGAEGAVAVMLPSGGGKSTLALRALEEDGVGLLSEDSPLVDRRGRLHPFPLRIGINATDADKLPEGSVRRLERMEAHPKLALELDAIADRIEPSPQPLVHLVIGRRTLGRHAQLEPVRRTAAIGTLVREAVVGVGIYQGMEFVLQRGLRDIAGKLDIAWVRTACCAAALARARVWRLTLGRDHDRNWAELLPLLR